MAVTKIHAITATVDKAVDYICNPDKTDESIYISSYACAFLICVFHAALFLSACHSLYFFPRSPPGIMTALKFISFRPLGKDRFVRGSIKSLGKEYTKERIKERIDRR